jgi:predicted amidophosphoribosyltransferase
MNIFGTLYETALEALFPLSPIERWLLNTDIETIISSVPRAKNMPILEAGSIFSYKDERVRHLIWSIKYKKSTRSALISATTIYRFIETFSRFVPHIAIIPMPITTRRRRERGFNQCELITEEMKKICAGEINSANKINPPMFINDLLVRSHHTSRQTLKDRKHRLASAHELFSVDQKRLIQVNTDATFIIIDDVVTTGSTMKEAVLAMRNAGLKNTWGLSVAH